MTDLAQQCEENRKHYDDCVAAGYHNGQLRVLYAYIDELKAQLSTANEQLDQWHQLDTSSKASIAELQADLAPCAEPVVQSGQLEKAIAILQHPHNACGLTEYAGMVIDALWDSEREKALVGEALRWSLENGGNLEPMNRLLSWRLGAFPPPQHIRPILLKHGGSK